MAELNQNPKVSKLSKKNLRIIGVVAIVIIAGVVGGIAWKKHAKTVEIKKAQEAQADVNKKNAFALAGLPIDEDPLVSTVKDLEKVKNSDFFKDAQVGDNILFFPKARKAGLFRASTGKFIKVAQVIGKIPAEFLKGDDGKEVKVEQVNIAVYNGSTKAENILVAQDNLSKSFKDEIAIKQTDLARLKHDQTIVVDLSGANKGLAESIAALLQGKVDTFPVGEKTPSAADPANFPEILIFLGNNVPEYKE